MMNILCLLTGHQEHRTYDSDGNLDEVRCKRCDSFFNDEYYADEIWYLGCLPEQLYWFIRSGIRCCCYKLVQRFRKVKYLQEKESDNNELPF